MSLRDKSPVSTSSPRQPSGKKHWNQWSPYNLTLLQLEQTTGSSGQRGTQLSHTLIYLRRAASISTALCHQLLCLTCTSTTLALYLATLRPCWCLFFHNRYILTNLAKFFEKNVAFIHLKDVASTAPGREREVWLSRRSVAFLCVCSEQWAAEKQHIQLVVTQATCQ